MTGEHEHRFDPTSGWCSGCTVRDDGRHDWHGDTVHAGPEYTPADLAAFLERGSAR